MEEYLGLCVGKIKCKQINKIKKNKYKKENMRRSVVVSQTNLRL